MLSFCSKVKVTLLSTILRADEACAAFDAENKSLSDYYFIVGEDFFL